MEMDDGATNLAAVFEQGAAPAPSNDGSRRILETASRLIDTCGIMKPPTFSGRTEDWPEYKWRLQAVLGLLDMVVALGGTRQPKGGAPDPREGAMNPGALICRGLGFTTPPG